MASVSIDIKYWHNCIADAYHLTSFYLVTKIRTRLYQIWNQNILYEKNILVVLSNEMKMAPNPYQGALCKPVWVCIFLE